MAPRLGGAPRLRLEKFGRRRARVRLAVGRLHGAIDEEINRLERADCLVAGERAFLCEGGQLRKLDFGKVGEDGDTAEHLRSGWGERRVAEMSRAGEKGFGGRRGKAFIALGA